MRKLKSIIRKAFWLISATSLLAFIAITVLWIRSYRAEEGFRCAFRSGDTADITVSRGILIINRQRYDGLAGSSELALFSLEHISTTRPSPWLAYRPSWTFAGFRFTNFGSTDSQENKAKIASLSSSLAVTEVNARNDFIAQMLLKEQIDEYRHMPSRLWIAIGPLWPIPAVMLVIPSLQVVAMIFQRRRAKKGFCHMCGYDLRATPDRCPECGTVPINAAGIQRPAQAEESA